MTLNAILKEMKEVPAGRLEEIYQFVHSLIPPKRKQKSNDKKLRNKILSFAGILSDMNAKEYSDFLKHSQKTRKKLFDRDIDL